MIEYESEDYRVVSQIVDPANATCVIAFQNFRNPQHKDEPHYAQKFLHQFGINGLIVTTTSNDWFLGEDMEGALTKIRELSAPFSDVVTYGSSMGGYAAIRFASLLNARKAIAISPQYSLNPAIFPEEKRWRREAPVLNYAREDNDFRIDAETEVTIVFDNLRYAFVMDAPHARRYGLHGRVNLIPFPFSGHPSMFFLMDQQLVAAFSAALIRGEAESVTQFRRQLRAHRRESSTYWANRGAGLSLRDPQAAYRCFATSLKLGAVPARIKPLSAWLPRHMREELFPTPAT